MLAEAAESLLRTAVVLLLLLVALRACVAQQFMPFAGGTGNYVQPSDPVEVYVSAYVDRLMFVDEKNYEFEALTFVYLSWEDAGARSTVEANRIRLRNASETCKQQCQLYPQNQANPVAGCCDDVWLPHISFPTLKLLTQDRVMRWGVNVHDARPTVAYYAIFLGAYMASFNLRAFPFDVQQLAIQMEIPAWVRSTVVLRPSAVGTRLIATKPDGDALSGWVVKEARMDTYTVPLCERYTQFASRPSAPGDPAPLVSHATFHSEAMRQRPAACAELLSPDDPSYLTYTEHAPGGKGATLQVSGVALVVVVSRFSLSWVLTAILPLIATSWFGFVVFLLPRDGLEARLATVLTIFVAQAAIQFVLADDLPSSSYVNALGQMVATGYVLLLLIGVEAVVIWRLTTWHAHNERWQQHKAARCQLAYSHHKRTGARTAEPEQGQRNSARGACQPVQQLPGAPCDDLLMQDQACARRLSPAQALPCGHGGEGSVRSSTPAAASSLSVDIPSGSNHAPPTAPHNTRRPGWCAGARAYWNAMLADELLADHAAHVLNKWLAILQFAGYNAAITAIFVCSWMMNRSSG